MAKKKLITHNGSIHADDLFAAATLSLLLEKRRERFEIIRTRDEAIVQSGDYVFDVGGIYDPQTNRFDHHQKEGAGVRENGIPYSSFGLVWKHFGLELCGGDSEVFEIIDNKIASPIDAIDNGIDVATPKFSGIQTYNGAQVFLVYSPTWKETEVNIDKIFVNQSKEVMKLLEREIKATKDDVEGRRIILESYSKSPDKRIVELSTSFPRYLYQQVLSSVPEPVYVIFPSQYGKDWKIEAVTKSPDTIESRKYFPESWSGYLDNDPKASEVIGVPGVTFSHKGRFLIYVLTKESAYKLAELALKS